MIENIWILKEKEQLKTWGTPLEMVVNSEANASERMASKAKVCNSVSYHLMELE